MQRTAGNWAPQTGQTPGCWKISKGCPHWAHFQASPTGGAALQTGQAKPSRRGNLSRRNNARACCSPLQQFMSMKTAMAPDPEGLSPEGKSDERGHTHEAEDGRDHQAAGASQHKPEQRAKNLAAIERIDGQDVEDQQDQKLICKRRRATEEASGDGVQPSRALGSACQARCRTGKSATLTSGPAAMLQSVAPGR